MSLSLISNSSILVRWRCCINVHLLERLWFFIAIKDRRGFRLSRPKLFRFSSSSKAMLAFKNKPLFFFFWAMIRILKGVYISHESFSRLKNVEMFLGYGHQWLKVRKSFCMDFTSRLVMVETLTYGQIIGFYLFLNFLSLMLVVFSIWSIVLMNLLLIKNGLLLILKSMFQIYQSQ